MKDYTNLSKEIIENVGGKKNIVSVQHCVTRLRFKLRDIKLANTDVLKKNKGVVTVMEAGGQYQVVIGNHVNDVYKAVSKQVGLDTVKETVVDKADKPKGFKWIVDFIMAATTPTLPLLCASGILKGLLALAIVSGVLTEQSGIYILLSAIGDAFFYFMPAFFGYNVSKKMNSNPFLGMLIGIILCYPTINGTDLNLFGHVVNITYSSSFLPVILLATLAAPVERFFNKVIPDVIKTFFVPLLVLLCIVPIGFVVIGPVANGISNALGSIITSLFELSPIIAGFIMGGIYQLSVVFGIHGMILLPSFIAVLSGTPDSIMAIANLVCFSQTAVVFAVYFKTRNKELKNIALPAGISGIFGVTEPAIYGVTLPRIKTFIISCIGGAITGLLVGLFEIKVYAFAGMGIIGLTGFLNPANPEILNIIIAVGAGAVVSFILTIILYKDQGVDLERDEEIDTTKGTEEKNGKKEIIYSPIVGKIIELSDINDQAFSDGLLGKGIAISPEEGKIYSPFDGVVMALYPTKHAIGILSDRGCEVLIHIGMDTVRLEGKFFKNHIEQNDKVKKGDLLISFDLEAIKKAGYETDTPIIITNTDDYLDVVGIAEGQVKVGDDLLRLFIDKGGI